MTKVNNLGNEFLYQAPLVFSALFAGVAIYTSEGDPSVRLQLNNIKQQLAHWSKMFYWGFKWNQLFVLGGTAAAITAYCKSN